MSELVRGGGMALVGLNAFGIYLALRDYVWRSSKKGPPDLQEAWKRKELVSSLSLGRLGVLSGLSRNAVRRALTKLEEVGWIEVLGSDTKTRVYLLGRVNEKVEVYFPTVEVALLYPRKKYQEGPEKTQRKPTGSAKDPSERGPQKTQAMGPQRTQGGSAKDPSDGSTTNPVTLNRNKECKQGIETSERPVRKVRRIPWSAGPDVAPQPPTPKPPPPSSANGERKLTFEEARHLRSALVKKAEERAGDYTTREVVAAWRSEYHRIFEVEDVDLRTKAARTRAARIVETRSASWFGGDRASLVGYLGASLRWWKRQKDAKASFPAALPSLEQLFEEKSGGRASWFFKQWQSGGMKPSGE